VTTPSRSPTNVEVPIVGPLESDVGLFVVDEASDYLGAAPQLSRIANRVLTNGEMIFWPSPCGSNCSYTTSFNGPAWQCIQMNGTVPQPILAGQGTLPEPYWAADTFMSNSILHENSSDPAEDGLWIVYGVAPDNNTIHCSLYNSTYTTQVQYSNNLPAINTTVVRHEQIIDTTTDAFKIIKTNPSDSAHEWALLNLYSIHNAVARPLLGNVQFQTAGNQFAYKDTLIQVSSFVQVNPFNFTFPDDLCERLENYLINTTLSLTQFLQDPPTSQINGSFARMPAVYASANATIILYPARYSYSPSVLWTFYSVAIACSILCVCLGCYMLYNNGVHAEMSFSQILVTTRNGTLDDLCQPEGEHLGGKGISQRLLKKPLKLGELRRNKEHVCFGIEAEIYIPGGV
jgi:hypothetical protein